MMRAVRFYSPLAEVRRVKSVATACRSLSTGVLKEHAAEQRVAMVPAVAAQLIKQGYKLNIEKGAGLGSGFLDSAYEEAGCSIVSRKDVIAQSELVFAVNPPEAKELPEFKGKTLVAWVGRLLPNGKEYVKAAIPAGVNLIDTTAVPRITTAQKLDVLSSQAKCAGHRAVLEGSYYYTRFYQGEITAAGKYPPTHTMVLGIGVAGLAAMGTSHALGSVVRAWDVRDVKDQVTSMGGKWISVDFKEDGAGAGGYAKESSPEFQAAQKATFAKHAKEVDIIITTAAIPGRKAPILIEKYMVDQMKAGSVIVDLAAAGGGNCELTKPGETYTTDNGVTIVGWTDLAGRMGQQASSMYAQNLFNLVTHVTGKDGSSVLMERMLKALDAGDEGDIIIRSIYCSRDGKEVVMPPPPQPTPVKKKEEKKEVKAAAVYDPAAAASQQATSLTVSTAAIIGSGTFTELSTAPPSTNELVTISLLAGAAGYQAVWGVAHALHTPLMSVTNAISGLTAAGGLMLLGGTAGGGVPMYLAWTATSLSVVNIFGGFIVSKRMLDLFKKPGDVDQTAKFLPAAAILAGAPWLAESTLGLANGFSGLMCIGAIGGLATQKTAQFGCSMGMIGVAGAMSATAYIVPASQVSTMAALCGVGAVGGVAIGSSVNPMALPQTVAAFHSLVGVAASFTSIASYMIHPDAGVGHLIAAVIGNSIGAITFTGSLIAFGKLNGNLNSAPMNLPGKNLLNVAMGAGQFGIAAYFASGVDYNTGLQLMWGTFALSSVFGVHLVGSVGGGDMPCCITVLNSYSGWALVAEGFLLQSPLLSIVGSLIGFSGAILTKIMCDAMNRDIVNVIFGGLNTVTKKKEGGGEVLEHRETNVDSVAELLIGAKNVCIVPGYGMAVSRAQGAVGDIAATLRAQDINVTFGIHPVAGRMPGQMNVLLAEAGVPYEWVLEMEEVNPDMDNCDVLLVVGANDITNSAALDDEDCPIYGMPVIEVWRAKNVIFMKRSMAAGYADMENPVFFKENTQMLLGDGKGSCEGIAAAVKTKLSSA